MKSHMSVSQYKRWQQCPAKEYAKQTGQYIDVPGPALHGGSYVDLRLFGGDAQGYAESNDMLTKSGALNRTSYGWCEAAIDRVKNSEQAMAMLAGESRVKLDFEFAGVQWNGDIDCLPEGLPEYFVDLKTCKDFLPVWKEVDGKRRPLPFYEAWDYWVQMAVYWYAVEKNRDPLILAVTKHKERPGLKALEFADYDRLERELERVEQNMPLIELWKSGLETAPGCGSLKCDWCRGESLEIERAESLF